MCHTHTYASPKRQKEIYVPGVQRARVNFIALSMINPELFTLLWPRMNSVASESVAKFISWKMGPNVQG